MAPTTKRVTKLKCINEPSFMKKKDINDLRARFKIPETVVLRVPKWNEPAHRPGPGEICVYEGFFMAGLRRGVPRLVQEFARYYSICPSQFTPNSWRFLIAVQVLGEISNVQTGVPEVLQNYYLKKLDKSNLLHLLHIRNNREQIVSELESDQQRKICEPAGWRNRFLFMRVDPNPTFPTVWAPFVIELNTLKPDGQVLSRLHDLLNIMDTDRDTVALTSEFFLSRSSIYGAQMLEAVDNQALVEEGEHEPGKEAVECGEHEPSLKRVRTHPSSSSLLDISEFSLDDHSHSPLWANFDSALGDPTRDSIHLDESIPAKNLDHSLSSLVQLMATFRWAKGRLETLQSVNDEQNIELISLKEKLMQETEKQHRERDDTITGLEEQLFEKSRILKDFESELASLKASNKDLSAKVMRVEAHQKDVALHARILTTYQLYQEVRMQQHLRWDHDKIKKAYLAVQKIIKPLASQNNVVVEEPQ